MVIKLYLMAIFFFYFMVINQGNLE